LNEALRYLFAELREAFQQSGASTDREGALRAVEAVSKFLMLFRVVQDEQLHLPFAALDNALKALDQNVVLPLVTPKQHSGRGLATEGRRVVMGAAAYVVASLQRLGTNRRDACEAVAKALRTCGVRPSRGSGVLTARTVREWCDAVSADYGRHTPAAQTFDRLSAEFDMALNNSPRETARKFLLDKLATTGRQWAQVDPIAQKDS
jgi:hypothetical protein